MRPTAILQIRTGSTRLPGKMTRDFHNGRSIPEIIVHNLLNILDKEHVVIATTIHPGDDPIEELANRLGVLCFRGSEEDVLGRFVAAIDRFEADPVIRICADNPFLRTEYLLELIHDFESGDYDYITFEFPDGTPVMKSHIGLFAEIMSASFLQELDRVAKEPVYREHVTNYIYEHREDFRTLFVPVPEIVKERRDIRLTIDTGEDFRVSADLYGRLFERKAEFTVAELVAEIDAQPELRSRMKNEIIRNSK